MNISRRFVDCWRTLEKISLERLTVAIALISSIIIIVSYADFYKLHLDFSAINGSFQTFNPIRRIFDSEIPGFDFSTYLGIGTTYFIAALAFLTGKNFAAVSFSNHFLHLFCHFIAFLVLLYLLGLSMRRSLLLASLIIEVITLVLGSISILGDPPLRTFLEGLITPLTTWLPLLSAWGELTTPGLSNLGIRSALPFLTSLGLLGGLHYFRAYRLRFAIFWGSLIGIQPLWSNDYGVISALILTFVALIYICKQQFDSKIQTFLIVISSATCAFFLVTTIVTWGHPYTWIQENFLGVAGDQFWYFDLARSKAFTPSQVLQEPFLSFYPALLCLLLIWVLITPINIRNILILYVALTTFGAGIVSSAGGSAAMRYFVPALLVSYFVIIFLILILFRAIAFLIFQKFPFVLDRLIKFKNVLSSNLLKKSTAFLLITLYTIGILTALDRLPNPPNSTDYFYAKKLGGWLSNSFLRGTEIAEEIRKETQDLPPQQRILSTYSSMIDTLAESKNATGIDYIIHALGEDARQRYRDRFHVAKPKYITTIREDYSTWETWIRRVNWWFYREFVQQYQPINATFYNILWQRVEQPKPSPSIPIQCTLDPIKSNSTNLILSSQTQEQGSSSQSTYYVDVELNYALDVARSGVPIIGQRGLVNAAEVKVAESKRFLGEKVVSYGLPPRHQHWHIPVIHRLGEPAILNLTGYPENRATLQVAGCKAEILAPTNRFEINQMTIAKNVTADGWINGIAVNHKRPIQAPTQAGFLFQDPHPFTLLIPSMMVEFPHGGVRQIVEIRGNEVWVTGEALDPKLDGYPNPINFKIR
ncbi:MAG: hypothetical protein NW224_20025 [Leptolyngbyaceae cyanobacterium bins.302]|nr:hypothetical protein [Leptolyngbyaceae cyanobacterium bins.302]